MDDGSMPSARAAWPASRLGDLVESHNSTWSPTRAVHDTGSMQACDRNGIENSASRTFAADFMAAGRLKIVDSEFVANHVAERLGLGENAVQRYVEGSASLFE